MQRFFKITSRLFGSLPGLLVVAVAWNALIVASLAPFSGPLQPLGLAGLLGVDLSLSTSTCSASPARINSGRCPCSKQVSL